MSIKTLDQLNQLHLKSYELDKDEQTKMQLTKNKVMSLIQKDIQNSDSFFYI